MRTHRALWKPPHGRKPFSSLLLLNPLTQLPISSPRSSQNAMFETRLKTAGLRAGISSYEYFGSCREPRFSCQHPRGNLQLSIVPGLGVQCPGQEPHVHIVHIHRCRQSFTHTKIIIVIIKQQGQQDGSVGNNSCWNQHRDGRRYQLPKVVL